MPDRVVPCTLYSILYSSQRARPFIEMLTCQTSALRASVARSSVVRARTRRTGNSEFARVFFSVPADGGRIGWRLSRITDRNGPRVDRSLLEDGRGGRIPLDFLEAEGDNAGSPHAIAR